MYEIPKYFSKVSRENLGKNLVVIEQSFHHHRIGGQFEKVKEKIQKPDQYFVLLHLHSYFCFNLLQKQGIYAISSGHVDFEILIMNTIIKYIRKLAFQIVDLFLC